MYWPVSTLVPLSATRCRTCGFTAIGVPHGVFPLARTICLQLPQLISALCDSVCVFLAKSLLPTPEVNDIQDHPGKMFDIDIAWYYCPVKPNHPDISKHIQTIQFHAIRTLSWTSSKHQCPTWCNYGTVASNLEKPMTQSKEWTSGLAGRLASANDISFL